MTSAPEAAPKPNIFISYGRGDDRIGPDDGDENYYYDPARSFTKRLYDALTAAGLNVWRDRHSLAADERSFLQNIRDAVDSHDKVLLVVGPAGMKSPYVRAEYEYALTVCKPVITILWKGEFDLVPDLGYPPNTIDFRDLAYFEDKVKALLPNLVTPPVLMGALHNVRQELPEWYVRRDEDLKAVADLLMQDGVKPVVVSSKHKSVTLHGMGGIGKSTLANALALDCNIRRFFPDGVFWLELGKEPNLATRMGDVGEAFGDLRAEYPDDQRAASRLSQVLNGKAALIILDNVWDSAHAGPFKVVNSRCRLLITTRKPRLHTLLGGVEHELDTLNDDEALQLVAKRLNREVAAFTAEQAATLTGISRQLGGLALAVEIAAGKIGERGLAFATAYLQRLQTVTDPFPDLQLSDDDKDHNVALSLKLSYDDLKDDMQRRFRALGIFAAEGTFDAAAVGAVWEDTDAYRVDELLNELVQVSLVTRTELTGETRYFQHPLLRAYARALLEQASESEEHFDRYADYVIEQSAQFEVLPVAEWGRLDPLLPHVYAIGDALVHRWETTTIPTEALTRRCGYFAWNVMRYVNNRPQAIRSNGSVELRGMNWMQMGLSNARQVGDQGREATTLNNIGGAWVDLGERTKALEYLEQALPLYRAVGDQNGEAAALTNIGLVQVLLGEMTRALECYKQALVLRQETGDKGGEGTTLNNIGGVWYRLGENQKALEYYEQAQLLRHNAGDLRGEAGTLNNVGLAWLKSGKPREALTCFGQALQMFQAVEDKGGKGTTLNNIGLAWSETGNPREALIYFERALPLRQEAGNRGGEAETSFNIALIYRSLGELDKAVAYMERCVQLNIEVEHPDLKGSHQILEYIKHERDGMEPHNLLPSEMILKLVGNTVAVRTVATEHFNEWQQHLQQRLVDFEGRGADYATEAVFVDALLAILDDRSALLPAGNPYADVVKQAKAAIAQYRANNSG